MILVMKAMQFTGWTDIEKDVYCFCQCFKMLELGEGYLLATAVSVSTVHMVTEQETIGSMCCSWYDVPLLLEAVASPYPIYFSS